MRVSCTHKGLVQKNPKSCARVLFTQGQQFFLKPCSHKTLEQDFLFVSCRCEPCSHKTPVFKTHTKVLCSLVRVLCGFFVKTFSVQYSKKEMIAWHLCLQIQSKAGPDPLRAHTRGAVAPVVGWTAKQMGHPAAQLYSQAGGSGLCPRGP